MHALHGMQLLARGIN